MTLLTATDVAQRWQCGKATVYRLARCGALASVRLSQGVVRFSADAVAQYEATHAQAERPQTWEQMFDLLVNDWDRKGR